MPNRADQAAETELAPVQRRVKAGEKHPRPVRPLTLSNEGRLEEARLGFGDLTPVSAHILPPFVTLPRVHICLSGYARALTMAAVTPENGEVAIGRFLDGMLEEMPAGEIAERIAR